MMKQTYKGTHAFFGDVSRIIDINPVPTVMRTVEYRVNKGFSSLGFATDPKRWYSVACTFASQLLLPLQLLQKVR
jgi:hypothetical protein